MASTLYVEKIELPTSSSETNISLKSGLTVLTVGNDALINDAKTVGEAGKNSMLVGPLTMNAAFTVAGSVTIV